VTHDNTYSPKFVGLVSINTITLVIHIPSHGCHSFPHKPCNKLPAIFRGLNAIEQIEILRLFLTDSLLKTITDNTNEYPSQKLAEEKRSGGRQWKEVVREDISRWLGIVLYMGIHSSPSVADYWKHD